MKALRHLKSPHFASLNGVAFYKILLYIIIVINLLLLYNNQKIKIENNYIRSVEKHRKLRNKISNEKLR